MALQSRGAEIDEEVTEQALAGKKRVGAIEAGAADQVARTSAPGLISIAVAVGIEVPPALIASTTARTPASHSAVVIPVQAGRPDR